jgi:hypothetical protein
MNDTPNGETAPLDAVKNDATQPTTTNTDADQRFAEIQKKLEQAEMRARQLENEKKEREKQEEVARNKKLEEDNEFRTLYEREKAQREALENEREENEKLQGISKLKSEIFAQYSPEVIEIAEAAGMTLYENSDEAAEQLKSRLDVIKSKVAVEPVKKVIGNNGNIDTATDDDRDAYLKMRFDDSTIAKQARQSVISKLPALDEMRRNAGLTK